MVSIEFTEIKNISFNFKNGIESFDIDVDFQFEDGLNQFTFLKLNDFIELLKNFKKKNKTLKNTKELLQKLSTFILEKTKACKINIILNGYLKVTKKVETVYLSLGSNIENRKENIKTALKKLDKTNHFFVDEYSSVYETKPVGIKDQDDYYNLVLKGRTDLKPVKLLSFIKEIEKDLGRVWKKRNYPRIIDIDILYYSDKKINTKELNIPHRELYNRKFVLIPLLELDNNMRDPYNFKRLKNYISDKSDVKKQIKKGDLF